VINDIPDAHRVALLSPLEGVRGLGFLLSPARFTANRSFGFMQAYENMVSRAIPPAGEAGS